MLCSSGVSFSNFSSSTLSTLTDDFSSSNNGGLDSNWNVQSGSFAVANQTATGGSSGTNAATLSGFSGVNEYVSATISGTLTSGEAAGLGALFTAPDTYYYGSIVAGPSGYTGSIYSVVNGTSTLLATSSSPTASVSDAVLEFAVSGSSLTLLLNGTELASATSSSITAPGSVGMLCSSGVGFINFSASTLSLVIVSDTAEVTPPVQLDPSNGVPVLFTLAEITATALATPAGGTVTLEAPGGITIGDLGQTATPACTSSPNGDSLDLEATTGSIVFLDLADTIKTTGTGTITIEAGTDLIENRCGRDLATSQPRRQHHRQRRRKHRRRHAQRGNRPPSRSRPPIGAISATGHLSRLPPAAVTLTKRPSPHGSTQSVSLAELNAAEVIAANGRGQREAVARGAADQAQADAELASANSFQAALTSIQAAVATDKQTI